MPLAVVSWPSNMKVSTSAWRSLSEKLFPFSLWEDTERGQGLSLPSLPHLWAMPQASHTHLGKEEDVQEVQVPLAPDLVQLSLLLQLSLPHLDHSVCPVQHSQAELRALGAQTQPPTVAHLLPVPQAGCQVDQEECGNRCACWGEGLVPGASRSSLPSTAQPKETLLDCCWQGLSFSPHPCGTHVVSYLAPGTLRPAPGSTRDGCVPSPGGTGPA